MLKVKNPIEKNSTKNYYCYSNNLITKVTIDLYVNKYEIFIILLNILRFYTKVYKIF